MLPLLLLPLEHPVGLLPQPRGGGTVFVRVPDCQLFHDGGGKTGVGEGQHGAGGPAQNEAQLAFGERGFQPEDVSRLTEVGGPAPGVGSGVGGQQSLNAERHSVQLNLEFIPQREVWG